LSGVTSTVNLSPTAVFANASSNPFRTGYDVSPIETSLG
jgi:hypothetical protein